ncbi:hypothetical protein C5O19_07365 [Siphonobacter curvatus]|uniref:Secretion system C-terminal sorting domain-containing protein n=2 Tax=Siphonobacter curvatus TaxID=2094562 RepID=A0A2S7IPF5_9BACT|nr:hypothetical protein C5O19_07365 [Siphonobacter curvatus]
MYYSLNGSTPIQLNGIQLPFYSSGHQLADAVNNDAKDMWQQDGWMLAYKDFGTSVSAPPYPFFILYNKYKGVFRVMIYNSAGLLNTFFKVYLSFRSSSPKSALFSFTEKRGGLQTLNNYDGSNKQVVITKANQGQGWIYADFITAGYVPDLSSNTILHLSVEAVNESAIQVSGSLTLDEITKSSAGGSDPLGDVKTAVSKGYKVYKDRSTALKDLGKPTTGFFASIFSIFSTFTDVVGIIDYFVSGKNAAAGREPMSFQGTASLTGTLTTPTQVVEYDFALSSSIPSSPDYYKPLQSIPWGVFNLTSNVDMVAFDNSQTYYCADKQTYVTDYSTVYKGAPISYIVNNNLNMSLVSVQARTLNYPVGGTGFFNIADIANIEFGSVGEDNCYGTYSNTTPMGLGIKFEFQINSPTKNYDNTIVLYKVYYFGSYSGRRGFIASENKTNVQAFPNPFSDKLTFKFPKANYGNEKGSIYDLKGTLVKKFTPQELSSGIVEWNGKTNSGNLVTNGVYLIEYIDNKGIKHFNKVIKTN